MDFMRMLRVCLEFAIENDATFQSYAENVQKIAIHTRDKRKEIYVERGSGDLWDIFSLVDEKTTVFPPVSSEDMLLSTLTEIWATPMQVIEVKINRTDAKVTAKMADESTEHDKCADIRKVIFKNTEQLDKILNSLQLIEQRLLDMKSIGSTIGVSTSFNTD